MASSERQAVEGSVDDDLEVVAPAAAGPGEGKRRLLHSLDYPCTARFRLRRLFAHLRGHGYAGVYEAARASMHVIFHVKDLVKKVKGGQWREAGYYVIDFTPFYHSGYEATLLILFLRDLAALNDFTDGRAMVVSYLCDWFISIYKSTMLLDKYPCFATLVADVLFLRSDHARAFIDWQLVRKRAAKMVEKMAYNTPELRDKMLYPRGKNNLYHVVPIGSRRRQKNIGPKQSTVAQFYLQMRKRLSLSQGSTHGNSGLTSIRGELLIELFETSLAAGRQPVHEQVQPPSHLSEEEFPLVRAKRACGFMGYTMNSQGLQRELSSRLDASQSQGPVVVVSRETNPAKKPSCFQESCRFCSSRK